MRFARVLERRKPVFQLSKHLRLGPRKAGRRRRRRSRNSMDNNHCRAREAPAAQRRTTERVLVLSRRQQVKRRAVERKTAHVLRGTIEKLW